MGKLRMELTVAGLAALGFAWVFVLHFYGWSPVIVSCVLYATVFMAGFLGSWLGLGARKLNLWQSIGVGSAGVLLVMAARG